MTPLRWFVPRALHPYLDNGYLVYAITGLSTLLVAWATHDALVAAFYGCHFLLIIPILDDNSHRPCIVVGPPRWTLSRDVVEYNMTSTVQWWIILIYMWLVVSRSHHFLFIFTHLIALTYKLGYEHGGFFYAGRFGPFDVATGITFVLVDRWRHWRGSPEDTGKVGLQPTEEHATGETEGAIGGSIESAIGGNIEGAIEGNIEGAIGGNIEGAIGGNIQGTIGEDVIMRHEARAQGEFINLHAGYIDLRNKDHQSGTGNVRNRKNSNATECHGSPLTQHESPVGENNLADDMLPSYLDQRRHAETFPKQPARQNNNFDDVMYLTNHEELQTRPKVLPPGDLEGELHGDREEAVLNFVLHDDHGEVQPRTDSLEKTKEPETIPKHV